MRLGHLLGLSVLAGACSVETGGGDDGFASEGSSSGSSGAEVGSGSAADETSGSETGAFKYDVGADTEGPGSRCSPADDMDAPGTCRTTAPPDSFMPEIQWTWTGEEDPYSIVIPLVANLTDDNDDGEIDLCDVPDVVVLAYPCDYYCSDANLYVLDGESGSLHFRIDFDLKNAVSPALGDIDNDGLPEIVAISADNHLVTFEHDGTLKWVGKAAGAGTVDSIALADLDNDGDVEIIHNHNLISDHEGNGIAFAGDDVFGGPLGPMAADLDDDGDLEVILGGRAYHHDGNEYFVNGDIPIGGFMFPQVADLDDDPEPEILVTGAGIAVLEHDGTTKFKDVTPTGEVPHDYGRPATIHDFDGDGAPEVAVKSELYYSLLEADGTLVWSAPVTELSFGSGGTAFDFLGDGDAEAIYGDEHTMFVFDETGSSLLEIPRTSFTVIEYPVVVDVDNDGSAEIVVVSNRHQYGQMPSPTVQVVRDVEDRWIQARRIWNQHTYHVTNVREDGTIPQFEPPHWHHLNTFRTNAQIEGGAVCKPAG